VTCGDLTRWHRIDGTTFGSVWWERFTPESLRGVEVRDPFRFLVVREEWDETVDPPTRVIHELRVIE
jgi:hypothetical protein